MIVAERKPFEEIKKEIQDYKKILVLGCGTCVAVCMAGGEKEVELLATELRMANKLAGPDAEIKEATIQRQCDAEFFDTAREKIASCDAVLSMACGVGVQMVARLFPDKPVYPALNTKFMGTNDDAGQWSENCLACGDCKLGRTGGVCPVTRCSKSLLNGPCGGSADGKCEVDPETIECGWHLIWERLSTLGQLDKILAVEPANDWSTAHDGGPRTVRREDVIMSEDA